MTTNQSTLTGQGLPVGDLLATLRLLQSDGMTPEDFKAIAQNGKMRSDIMAAVFRHRLFTPPEEQIKKLLEINEAVWKDKAITEAAIRGLGNPPECPISDETGLYCVGLFYETGDAVKTFQNNWDACVHVFGKMGTWKWGGVIFTPKGVRQRHGAKVRSKGLRWAVLELGRKFQRQSVEKVRPQLDADSIMGMGQELPLVAALHPHWAKAMNGNDIPFVDAPDLDISPHAYGDFCRVPYLYFDAGSGEVYLSSSRVGNAHLRYGSGWFRQ